LETVMADLNRRIAKLLGSAQDPRARLGAVIKGCLDLADENRQFWVVFVEFWGEMMHDHELLRFNAALYQQIRRTLGALVAEGARSGVFRRIDPEEAGAVILALVDGVSLQRTFDPKAFTREQAARFCDEAIGRYLEKRSGQRSGTQPPP